MQTIVLERMTCPACAGKLRWHVIESSAPGRIDDGVVYCQPCRQWWAVEDQLLELLPPTLAYHDDRERFWRRHERQFTNWGLPAPARLAASEDVAAQVTQQKHFDWYAANDKQSYSTYQQLPFWRAVDAENFARWRQRMRPDDWMLDVGCAQGRSLFPFVDLPLQIVGTDISKALVREALEKYRSGGYAAKASFYVGDASNLPFRGQSFERVLIYGVLHHLPRPGLVCREIERVLTPGGTYLGSENNKTIFRRFFDWLQRLAPIWHEEAGEQPLIGAADLNEWFAGRGVTLTTHTHVFVPPHLVNLLGHSIGTAVLRITDAIGRRMPFLRNNGGLIVIEAAKSANASTTSVRKAA